MKTKTETKTDFAKGDYITSEYYEKLLEAGYRTYQGKLEFSLIDPTGKTVHQHVACKDGYRLFLETIPEGLI